MILRYEQYEDRILWLGKAARTQKRARKLLREEHGGCRKQAGQGGQGGRRDGEKSTTSSTSSSSFSLQSLNHKLKVGEGKREEGQEELAALSARKDRDS